MANDTGATESKTPPRNSALPSEHKLQSTPQAVGSAVASEHIGTRGVHIKLRHTRRVNDVRPWIRRDVENFRQCGADRMLQDLLEKCIDPSQSLPASEKSMLLKTTLETVLPLCQGKVKDHEIKRHLRSLRLTPLSSRDAPTEPKSYDPFVRAANCALLQLSKVDVPGIPAFKDDDNTNILFHTNDPSLMYQTHQGAQSERKPDVVIVSYQTAWDAMSKEMQDDLDNNQDKGKGKQKEMKQGKEKVFMEIACKKPHGDFQWMDVRSTVEFKRTRKPDHPPSKYDTNLKYVKPKVLYMDLKNGRETKEPAEPTGSTSAAGPAQTSHKASTERKPLATRMSARLNPASADNKRGSDHLPTNDPPPKRSKSNNEIPADEKEPKKIHPIVQNGLYVAEMFAAHIARQHVISFIVNNDIIHIWYFDRQNTIQCAGINFVKDLPRFIVLLLIMQRMQDKQWGLNPDFKPDSDGKIFVHDEKMGVKVDLELDSKSDECTTHFGLLGRATTVFPVKSTVLSQLPKPAHYHNESTELVAKLYWPEESRESEAAILEEIYRIAKNSPEVEGHVPEMVWFHKFEETSTENIRKALGVDDKNGGSRVLYIIVFRKMIPITTLSGIEFLTAWWETVICHRALWKKGVRHRDISPNNLMVYSKEGRFIGVLNDYDLSSIRDSGPSGLERTGTVPFMAMDLLTPEAIAGEVEHLYQHDAESFIWVLTWVCLRYEEGTLLSKDRPLDDWLRVDAPGCHDKKTGFLSKLRSAHGPLGSHKENWKVAMQCLKVIYLNYGPDMSEKIDDGEVFQLWLHDRVPTELHGVVDLSDK
ncbi:hypothetical protein BDR05DRAFT_1045369 [Suillus weaverae]|nr:hypothetical protein BDR05DRAFT_1045369 [Suillus weaverae]